MRRFDEQRVQNLQNIQGEIVYYWQNKSRLPEKLSDLNDDIRGFHVPVDPEKGTAYGYEVKGGVDFALCAEFSLPASDTSGIYPHAAPYPVGAVRKFPVDSWAHDAGHVCFSRHIDKDFYGPKPLTPPAKSIY